MDIINIHILSTAILTGAIWVIQLIHYPGFGYIENKLFKPFMVLHIRGIMLFVFPMMLVEICTGTYLLFQGHFSSLFLYAMIFLYLIWLSTALIFSGYHSKLKDNKDDRIINNLVKYNWVRTIGWSFRLILLFMI